MLGGSVGYNSSESKSVSKTLSDTRSKGESLGLEIQNSFAVNIAKRTENAIARLQKELSTGFWQTATCFSTSDDISMKILQGCLYSEMAKPDVLASHPKIFNYGIIENSNQSLIMPHGMLDTDKNNTHDICSFANTEELSLLFALPDKNVPGYELKTGIRYPVSQKKLIESESIELGNACDGGNVLDNIPFSLSSDDLNKHTFVCGITGSGKTNTVKHILARAKGPFG